VGVVRGEAVFFFTRVGCICMAMVFVVFWEVNSFQHFIHNRIENRGTWKIPDTFSAYLVVLVLVLLL
jgi:hypothetical protein